MREPRGTAHMFKSPAITYMCACASIQICGSKSHFTNVLSNRYCGLKPEASFALSCPIGPI